MDMLADKLKFIGCVTMVTVRVHTLQSGIAATSPGPSGTVPRPITIRDCKPGPGKGECLRWHATATGERTAALRPAHTPPPTPHTPSLCCFPTTYAEGGAVADASATVNAPPAATLKSLGSTPTTGLEKVATMGKDGVLMMAPAGEDSTTLAGPAKHNPCGQRREVMDPHHERGKPTRRWVARAHGSHRS